MAETFHREYLLRLPLPLAQLYSRAYNAKDARGRHDNSFYLFEAMVKLASAPLVACYLRGLKRDPASRVPALDQILASLALPSLGQWAMILRELSRHFSLRPDAATHPLGHLFGQLSATRHDLPDVLALYRRIKNGPDGEPGGDQSCSLQQLIDALVQYRNGVFGHGAGRFESFYEKEMGPLLLPAVNELFAEGTLDLLGPRGSRLMYVTELRGAGECRFELGLRELVGLQGERSTPLMISAEQADEAAPNQVAVLWPGARIPLQLGPMLRYREDDTAAEVLFLNRDRNGRQVEYLSYTTGRTERDRQTAAALTAMLSLVTQRNVGEQQLEELARQSLAETPSVDLLFGAAPPAAHRIGDYETLAELGRGGMGVVYLARQSSLGRVVALKMLPADLSGDEVALARFRREMRALARCESPHIVKVLSSGSFPDGQLYYAMEYVPGCDLEQVWRELSGPKRHGAAAQLGNSTWTGAVLAASRTQREHAVTRHAERKAASGGGASSEPAGAGTEAGPAVAGTGSVTTIADLPLPPLPETPDLPGENVPGGFARRVALMMRDAALALQVVHEQQIVHRDVKPGNFMLTSDGGRIVLMDFGLAKGQSLSLSSSRQGGLLGTLRYAAPEQLAAASLKVGPPADVHGLGVTMWELLARQRLFADAQDEQQLATLVHEQDVPRLRKIDPSIDRDLEAIVARATERRVADRIPTARELAGYLDLYLQGRPLPIRPATTRELLARWMRANPGKAVAAVAVVALLAAAAGMFRANEKAAMQRREQEQRLLADRLQEITAQVGGVRAKLTSGDWPEAHQAVVRALGLAEKPPVMAQRRETLRAVDEDVTRLAEFDRDANEAWFAAGQERNDDARRACRSAIASLPGVEDRGWWSRLAARAEFPSSAELLKVRDQFLKEEHRQLLLLSLLLMNRGMVSGEALTSARAEEKDAIGRQKAAYFRQAAETLKQVRALERREPELAGRSVEVMEQMCDLGQKSKLRAAFQLLGPRPATRHAIPELNATDAYFMGMASFFVGSFHNDTLTFILQRVEGLDLGAPPLVVADHELRVAAAREPRQYWPTFLLGWTLQQAGKYEQAELAFDTCVAVQPDNPRGYEQRGLSIARRAQGTPEKELRAQLLERATRDLDQAYGLAGPNDPSVQWSRAELFRMLERRPAALEAYSRALELDEQILQTVSRRAVLTVARDYGASIAADRKSPDRADALTLLAMLDITNKQWATAAATAGEALAINPEQVRALVARGTALTEQGHSADAIADFEHALKLSPGNYYASFGRARAQEAVDPGQSLAAYDAILLAPSDRTVLETSRQRHDVCLGQSRALLALGRKAEALAAAREAEASDPADPGLQRVLTTLGVPSTQASANP